MLETGKECGLTTLQEAHACIMIHYDAYFSIENFNEEYNEYLCELRELDFTQVTEKGEQLRDMTIQECLDKLEGTLYQQANRGY